MSGYAFHPEARRDLEEIWEFIRSENLDAADRVVGEVLETARRLAASYCLGFWWGFSGFMRVTQQLVTPCANNT